MQGKRFTTDEFVARAMKIHGDKYDYSLVEYKNQRTKVVIVCPVHGEFEQEPINHMNGHGCNQCACEEVGRKTSKDIQQSFDEKSPDRPMFDCWEWYGAKNSSGYGEIGSKGKHIKAHRLSYQLHRGDIPSEMVVMHICDNPSCVNPYHLSVGTQADNIQDMIRKGRDNSFGRGSINAYSI